MITAEKARLLALASQAASDASDGKVPSLKDPNNLNDTYTYRSAPELNDSSTGLCLVIFQKNGTSEYIVAFADSGDAKDFVADVALGMPQWSDANKNNVFNYLNELGATSVDFTGRSLGGVVAQYAAYDYKKDNPTATVSLATYNAFGGKSGLEQRDGVVDPSIAPSLDTAHFYTSSGDGKDVAARCGEGHLGGNVYEIQMTETNADVIDIHKAWNYFNTLTEIPQSTTAPDYLNITGTQKLAAMVAYVGDDKKMSNPEAFCRTAGGLMVAVSTLSPSEINQLTNALLPNATFWNWTATILSEVALASPFMRLELAVAGMAMVGAVNGIESGIQLYQNSIDWTTDQIGNTVKLYELTAKISEQALKLAIEAGSAGVGAARDLYIQTLDYAAARVMDLVGLYDSAVDYTASKLTDLQNLRNQVWRWLRGQENEFRAGGGDFGGGGASGSWDGPTSVDLSFCKDLLNTASTVRFRDPLILDLDNDGLETTNVKDGAYFDNDGNGFAEQTGWASSDDGLLVMDRNNNGTIDNGTELFGDQTILQNGQRATDGFQALAELDSNADGIIDINDTAFSNLRIWQDIDGDGYSASDELFTLQEMGIQSINVAHTDTNTVDPQGNTQIQAGTFTRTDGSTASIGGFNLQRDVTYSIATEWLDVPDDIAALPDLQGYGNTYDLHQAMARDTTGTLKSLIEQFIAAEDPTVRNSLMEQILFKWTGSDTIDPASRGGNFDARKLAVIEKLMGQAFAGANGSDPNTLAAPLLAQAYEGLFEMYYAQIMAQTHLKYVYDAITYTWDEATQSLKGDLNAAIAALQSNMSSNQGAADDPLEFMRTIHGFSSEDMFNLIPISTTFELNNEDANWQMESAGRTILSGTGANDSLSADPGVNTAIRGDLGDDVLYGNTGSDVLYGNEGADTLIGGCEDDILNGGKGNDMLYGQNANDTLIGGSGNDTLKGGQGDDTYVYSKGFDHDMIIEEQGNDTIQFKELTQNDIEYFISSNYGDNGLVFRIKDTGETLRIKDWFAGDQNKTFERRNDIDELRQSI